jgi:phage-related protein
VKDRELDFWDEDQWKAIIKDWPKSVKKTLGSRLRVVQKGKQPESGAKPLSDFKLAVWELWVRSGQRVIYTTAYAQVNDCVYVLDAFEKDSREGRKMRKSDRKRIEGRVTRLKEQIDRFIAEAKAQNHLLH